MSDSVLNKSPNYFRCVGTLYESSLKREPCDIKLKKDGKPNGTTKGERIMGNISIKTGKGTHTFNVYFQDTLSNGEPSRQWKMATDMLTWNPQVGGNKLQEASLVSVEGSVAVNDYVGQDGNVKTSLRWRVSRASTKVEEDEPTGTTLKATLFLKAMKHESRNDNETGRLLVTFYGVDGMGACFPVNAIVDKDIAEDFEQGYEIGMTIPCDFELVSRHIGGKSSGKKKLGRAAEVSTFQSFDIQELMLVGGDDEVEEPESDTELDENGNEVPTKSPWINPAAMNKALKERAKMLEELKEKGYQGGKKESKSTSVASNLKADKAAAKSKSKVGQSKPEPDYDFTDDEDFDESF